MRSAADLMCHVTGKLAAAKAAAAGVAAVDGLEQPGSSAAGSAEVDAAVQNPQQEVLAAADEAVLLGFVERLKTPVYAALNDLERAGQLQTVRVANATADEVIAAFVHLKARSSSPSRVVIKSGDKDFWQLGVYEEQAPILVNTALIPTNFLVQQVLNWPKCQRDRTYEISFGPKPHNDLLADMQLVQQQFQQQLAQQHPTQGLHQAATAEDTPADATSSYFADDSATADTSLALHEALQLGGAAFDSLPPTHPAYAWHYTAFIEAVRAHGIWEQDTAGILEWLNDYRAQVPGISARFLALTVHNNINPLNEWNAAPQDIRRACTAAFERYILKLPVQDTARNSTRGTSEARAHPQHHQGQAQAGALHRTGGSWINHSALPRACTEAWLWLVLRGLSQASMSRRCAHASCC